MADFLKNMFTLRLLRTVNSPTRTTGASLMYRIEGKL